jgi:hypothetical protein
LLRILRNLAPVLVLVFLMGCRLGEQPAKPTVSPLEGTPSSVVSATPAPGATALPEGGTPASETEPTRTLVRAARATRTRTVTLTPTVTQTLRITRTPTLTPTITLTPTLNPKAILLRIAEPGPMSKVTSPIKFIFYISPDFVGDTHIDLFGEDGRSLYSKGFRTFSTEGATKVSQDIDFQIPGTGEIGRLQVSTYDKMGRMLALSSVRVLLLSIGETQLNPPFPSREHILLRAPLWDDEISGGQLKIAGEIQPVNGQAITIELIDNDGYILATQQLTSIPANGTYRPFSISLPYRVEIDKVPAHLIFRQDDDRIAGLAYFFSREVFLSP